MSWEKVSETRWERPVDGIEGYFAAMAGISASLCGGREHYTLFSKIKLETTESDAVPAINRAWQQIRYEQPQIAATVEGMKKVYEVPDEKALGEWVASTFIVSSASDAEELYLSVKPIKQGLFNRLRFTIRQSPRKWCFVAIITHLMALAFSYSGTATWKHSARRPRLGAVPSGRCQNTELVFSADVTNALVTACKGKGVSVSAAVHAAYIKAIAKHADPNSKLSEYATATQFNLRPYLPEPYNSSKYAVSVYYSPLPYKIDLPASYWDIAKSLHEYYQTSFKGNPEALELKGHFTRALCGAVQTPEFLASPIPKDALVSSLGIAERYLKREYGSGIKVQDLKVGVDVVMGMSTFFFYTFQDQLRLVYSFNDGFEKADDIQRYLEEVQAILT